MKRVWLKAITLLIALTFIFPYFTWAFEPSTYPIPSGKVSGIQLQGKPVYLPDQLGTIEKASLGSNKIIIHVQDLHCNYEVQKNIAGMIHFFAKEHGLKLVGEEGAFHAVDVNDIRSFPVPEIRQAVSEYFVRQGKLTGAEYYGGTGEYPIRLEGIETPKLYEDSLRTVRSFLNSESQGYCQDLREIFDALKPEIYSRTLQAVDQARSEYRNGRLDVLAYATRLRRFAVQYGVDLAPYPNLEKYLRLNRNVFGAEVEPDRLFHELDTVDEALRRGLYTTELQREFDTQYRRLDILEKLLSISATQEELRQFQSERDQFNVEAFADFLRRHTGREETGIDSDSYRLDQSLDRVEAFYQMADVRSREFAANLTRKMDASHETLAVVVTGGFHTDGFLAELQKQNIGYLSVKPCLTRQDVANPYFSILQGRKLPIEKLLAKNQTILAPRVFPETEGYTSLVGICYGSFGSAVLERLSPERRRAVETWLQTEHDVVVLRRPTQAELMIQTGWKALPDGCDMFMAQTRTKAELLVLLTPQHLRIAGGRETEVLLEGAKQFDGLALTVYGDWPSLKRAVGSIRVQAAPVPVVQRLTALASAAWRRFAGPRAIPAPATNSLESLYPLLDRVMKNEKYQQYRAPERLVAAVTKQIDALLAKARADHRLRALDPIHVLTPENTSPSPVNAMLNVLTPGTYVRPHRHGGAEGFPDKDEYFYLLRGKLGILFYDDNLNITRVETLDEKNRMIRISPGTWHSVVCLEDSAMLEVKTGTYDPNTDKQFNERSPEEAYTADGKLAPECVQFAQKQMDDYQGTAEADAIGARAGRGPATERGLDYTAHRRPKSLERGIALAADTLFSDRDKQVVYEEIRRILRENDLEAELKKIGIERFIILPVSGMALHRVAVKRHSDLDIRIWAEVASEEQYRQLLEVLKKTINLPYRNAFTLGQQRTVIRFDLNDRLRAEGVADDVDVNVGNLRNALKADAVSILKYDLDVAGEILAATPGLAVEIDKAHKQVEGQGEKEIGNEYVKNLAKDFYHLKVAGIDLDSLRAADPTTELLGPALARALPAAETEKYDRFRQTLERYSAERERDKRAMLREFGAASIQEDLQEDAAQRAAGNFRYISNRIKRIESELTPARLEQALDYFTGLESRYPQNPVGNLIANLQNNPAAGFRERPGYPVSYLFTAPESVIEKEFGVPRAQVILGLTVDLLFGEQTGVKNERNDKQGGWGWTQMRDWLRRQFVRTVPFGAGIASDYFLTEGTLNLETEGAAAIRSTDAIYRSADLRKCLNRAMNGYFRMDKNFAPSLGERGKPQRFIIRIEKNTGLARFFVKLLAGRYLMLDNPVVTLPGQLLSWHARGSGPVRIAAEYMIRQIILISGRQRFQPGMADRLFRRAAGLLGFTNAHWQFVLAAHAKPGDPLRTAALALQPVFRDHTLIGSPAAVVLVGCYRNLLEPFTDWETSAASGLNEKELDARLHLLQEMKVSGLRTIKVMTSSGQILALPVPSERRSRRAIVNELRRTGVKILDRPVHRPEHRLWNRFLASA